MNQCFLSVEVQRSKKNVQKNPHGKGMGFVGNNDFYWTNYIIGVKLDKLSNERHSSSGLFHSYVAYMKLFMSARGLLCFLHKLRKKMSLCSLAFFL